MIHQFDTNIVIHYLRESEVMRQVEQQLDTLLDILNPIDIWSEDILERYAEMDAFSQNKLPARPLGLTARNMGKNDLWIAATASILDAQLITTDADFDHLGGTFLKVGRVSG